MQNIEFDVIPEPIWPDDNDVIFLDFVFGELLDEACAGGILFIAADFDSPIKLLVEPFDHLYFIFFEDAVKCVPYVVKTDITSVGVHSANSQGAAAILFGFLYCLRDQLEDILAVIDRLVHEKGFDDR